MRSAYYDFVSPSPVVEMEPTTFRTFRLTAVGIPNAAIRLAQSAPYNQRIVFRQPSPGVLGGALIANNAMELEIPGQGTPGDAYRIAPGRSHVFVITPGEHLDGVGAATGDRISVSVSQDIPVPLGSPPGGFGLQPTQFVTYTLPPLGTADAIRITPTSRVPRRVIITQGTGFISDSAEELNLARQTPLAGQARPGGAFEGEGIFVLAPQQALYAIGIPLVTSTIQVSVSDIHLPHAKWSIS